MKVFGIGLNKTGTKTLGICLQFLGFRRHLSCDIEALRHFKSKQLEPIFEKVEKNDCFEDWPWPLMYDILYEKYPESKFILTLRETPEIWFDSLCKFALLTGPTEHRELAYGYAMPHNFKEEHISFYNQHIESVHDKPYKLLTVCWERGDGWREICSFLDKDIPNIPFPHVNKSSGKEKRSLQATIGDTVMIHLICKLKDGTIIHDTSGKEPLEFTIGMNQVIPGLEESVISMSTGESKIIEISANKAFGPYSLRRDHLPNNIKPELGHQLTRDNSIVYTVIHVSEGTLLLDSNHPFAGKDLILNILLQEIV